jgi:hypothetical protein
MRLRVGGPQFSRWAESILEILSTTASLLIIGIGAMLVTLPVLLPVFEHLRCQPDLVRRAAGQAAGNRHDYAPRGHEHLCHSRCCRAQLARGGACDNQL